MEIFCAQHGVDVLHLFNDKKSDNKESCDKKAIHEEGAALSHRVKRKEVERYGGDRFNDRNIDAHLPSAPPMMLEDPVMDWPRR